MMEKNTEPTIADAGGKKEPEKKSWADLEEDEEAKAEAEAAAESSSSKTESAVEKQAMQIEALLLAAPEEEGSAEGPPLHDDFDDSQIQAVTSGGTVYESASTFEDLKLSPELLKGLHDGMGFSCPSKIRAITLPMILAPPYKDLVAQAHNGYSKTTCFVLGMLSRVNPNLKFPQAICICPTRELAQQAVLMRMGKFTGITCAYAILPAQKDYVSISRMPPITDQVVIGTSGTLIKWINHKKLPTGDEKNAHLFVMSNDLFPL
ncbi:hypothetical protein PR202_ga10321 [Eleusine coracana subsp. coracana]|uniref:ATP-dependent RNA helicase n=1 Tax=Eleusine coracana subsp. coracana TaxID=191504 RepID=A0AAV5C6F2_ELECO|nr:hypothetical protein PR202_ga10321 [Eleusine coracana subsp. coracana]